MDGNLDGRLAVSPGEAAELLGVSKPKFYELMKFSGFPVIRLGRRVLIPVDGLRQWLATVLEAQTVEREEVNRVGH